MTASTFSIDTGQRKAAIRRWRRRSHLIRALRVVLPGLIVVILIGLAGMVAYSTLTAQPPPKDADEPIRLTNPRFVGRDGKGRAFVLTAISATRDPHEYQRVALDHPALIFDEEGPDPIKIVGGAGVLHEDTGKLDLSGGVKLVSARAVVDTAQSLFDTKTGELVGSGPVHGVGSLGEISAKSYGVYDKGDHMVFKGGVHSRLDSK